MSSTYFVFIITSRDLPIYEQFDSMRRLQMNSLGIPHKFLINGSLPVGYTLQDDEEYFEDTSFTPGMFMKFYNACKHLDTNYDFIIRVNSSTFINFLGIPSLLVQLPKEKSRAGYPLTFYHDTNKIFIAGYLMIFSKDVINYIINEISLDQPVIYNSPDDCSLSIVTEKYCGYLIWNLTKYFEFIQGDNFDFTCIKPSTLFFRIKNTDRISTDINIWKNLLLTYQG